MLWCSIAKTGEENGFSSSVWLMSLPMSDGVHET